MAEVRYRSGETLFEEGESSDCVLRIVLGEVEALKTVSGRQIVLGHLRAGEFVGEMGVLEDQPRSATVRAVSDVVAERMDRDSFLHLVSTDAATAFNLLARLSERLAAIDHAYAESMAASAPDPLSQYQTPLAQAEDVVEGYGALTLYAATDTAIPGVPPSGIAITEFPFVIGREVRRGETRPAHKIDLVIRDEEPYRLSRLHFWFARGSDGLRVRDRGSTLGTIVNGTGIGHHFARDNALLDRGENTIVAGGIGSPYAFRVVLA